jgi:predicted transcriptional regulator
MTTRSQQELMAKFHHLNDHLTELDCERKLVKKELEQVIAALLKRCLNRTIPN